MENVSIMGVVGLVSEGTKIKLKTDYVRIMAIREGYIMARRTGATPFVKSIKDFQSFIFDNK